MFNQLDYSSDHKLSFQELEKGVPIVLGINQEFDSLTSIRRAFYYTKNNSDFSEESARYLSKSEFKVFLIALK